MWDTSQLTMSGGIANWGLRLYYAAGATVSGGWVRDLATYGTASLTLSGGEVWASVVADEFSEITISGGKPGSWFAAAGSSQIWVEGKDFKVDGASVPFGDLAAETGTLTGKLASGEAFNDFFYQGQAAGLYYTGTITLVDAPEPSLSVLNACALAVLALLAHRASSPRRRKRQRWHRRRLDHRRPGPPSRCKMV